MKKFFTVLLSFAMILAMAAVAFAANPSAGSTIPIEKNLKVTNPTLTSVDGPGATFTYAVAPVAPSAANGGITITDGNDHTGTVHQGPADGITLSDSGTISYPVGTAVNASPTGADNKKSINATADVTKFSAPGIYRYQVSETSNLGDCEASNTDGTRYIDVYVVNGNSGLEVSGLVLHDGSTKDGAPAQKKTFDNAAFETVNVTLKKEVAGNMADKNNQFPFTAAISDHGRFHYTKKGAEPLADDATSTAATESTTLAHSEMYYISGLSKSAMVGYTETNNTQDTYQVVYTGGESSAVAANGTKEMAATDVDDAAAIVFTNTYEEASATGVNLRFGAPIFIFATAAVLFVVNRKSKRKVKN